MHFLRLFLAFIRKLCLLNHFIFQKLIKGRGWNKSGGLENFSKINKRGGGRLFGTREQMILHIDFRYGIIVRREGKPPEGGNASCAITVSFRTSHQRAVI